MKVLLLASAAALSLGAAAFAQEPAAQNPSAQKPATQEPAATAPQTTASPQATASPPVSASVSDIEVKGVAALAADVKGLNATHQPKIAAAADATAKAAAQKELDTAIQASLTKHGLSVERYNEIARAATADRALAARISAAGSASTGTPAPSSATEPARE